MSAGIFFYKAIPVECIIPEVFPPVSLYLKNGPEAYVLYKAKDNPFTENDYARMRRNSTHFLYFRNDDEDLVHHFMEQNLTMLLERDDLDGEEKESLLHHTATNYIVDVFKTPENIRDFDRSRELIRTIIRYISHNPDVLNMLHLVTGDYFYVFTHCTQVMALTMYMHEQLFGLGGDELVDVGLGAMFHDIGLPLISGSVCDRPDALAELPPKLYEEHAEKGYGFLERLGHLGEMPLNIVRYHHERYDGSGYPKGLAGDAIPRSAQITGICDTYCSLTTERPNREASTCEEALSLMRNNLKYFNPDMFARFESLIMVMEACEVEHLAAASD